MFTTKRTKQAENMEDDFTSLPREHLKKLIKNIFVDELNSNTLPRRGKNADVSRRSVSDADMNGRQTPPGIIYYMVPFYSSMHEQYTI